MGADGHGYLCRALMQSMNESKLLAGFAAAMSPQAYRARFESTVAAGRAAAEGEVSYPPAYTKLNLARTRRIEKTLQVPGAVQEVMRTAVPQAWLVITEEWCGDSAQSLPVLLALAALAPAIEVGILPRDAHLDIMDLYLTDGGRSIPKLVAFDPSTGREYFTWGPRPAAARALIMTERAKPEAERMPFEQLSEELHRWYAGNGGLDVCTEIADLVRRSV